MLLVSLLQLLTEINTLIYYKLFTQTPNPNPAKAGIITNGLWPLDSCQFTNILINTLIYYKFYFLHNLENMNNLQISKVDDISSVSKCESHASYIS